MAESAGAPVHDRTPEDPGTPPVLVSPAWLASQLPNADLVVLDATVLLASPRFDGDYRVDSGATRFAAGHIPGARHADLLEDLSDPGSPSHFAHLDPARLGAQLARLGVTRDARVVTYDSEGGFWAARLWWVLHTAGFRAQVLDGGLATWTAAGLPVDTGPARPWQAAMPWRPEADPSAWIDRAGVEDIVAGRREGLLVCALGPDSFDGSAPTRYARRGHIPGSINLPAHALFDADRRYLDPENIRRSFSGLLGSPVRPIVLYCGGGISAAASALALTIIGERSLAIYDGSLEEWAADPTLPLRTSTGNAPAA